MSRCGLSITRTSYTPTLPAIFSKQRQELMRTIPTQFLLIVVSMNIFGQTNSSTTDVEKMAVSTAHPLATQAGLDILRKGGNAFDAAVAIAATLNVVEPMMSGIGGYGTILIYDVKERRIRYLNPSGRFPMKTNTDLMREPTPDFEANRVGSKSISTPGNLNAWASMHDKYGKLTWSNLFQSAIQHAEKGFIVSSFTARVINYSYKDFSNYTLSFYGRNGRPLHEGDTLVQQDLGNVFRRIAKEGPAPFYSGDIAQAIDKKMNEVGSFLSIEDLRNNKSEWFDPIRFNYKGYDVYTASPPANSFAAFVNLGLMQELSQDKLQHNSVDYLHLFAEMTKESYKARLAYSFDPDIRQVPLDSILSKNLLRDMASKLNRTKASVFVPPFSSDSKNTTHFVVVDQWGNIVSSTQTLGNIFGSRIMVEGTGIWLNNSMAYSTFEPKGNPMDAFPGRHKLSGDCPVIIMKGKDPWAALGTPGGHTITQNVPQIIFNLIDFNMTMQDAIDASKICFEEPNIIVADPDLSETTINALRERGHQVEKGKIGDAHGVKIMRDKKGKIIGFDVGVDKRGRGSIPVRSIR